MRVLRAEANFDKRGETLYSKLAVEKANNVFILLVDCHHLKIISPDENALRKYLPPPQTNIKANADDPPHISSSHSSFVRALLGSASESPPNWQIASTQSQRV